MRAMMQVVVRRAWLTAALVAAFVSATCGQENKGAERVQSNVWEVAFSPDGSALAAAIGAPKASGHVMVWNTKDWSLRFHHRDGISCAGVCYSNDNRFLVCTNGGPDAFVLDAATGKELRRWRVDETRVYAACWLPGQQVIATGGADKSIHLWDTESGAKLRDLEGHTGTVYDLEAFEDGRILSCSSDRTARVWNATSGEMLHTFKYGTLARRGVFSSDGKYLCVVGWGNRSRIYDSRSYELLMECEGGLEAAQFTPDVRYLISSGVEGAARVFDCRLGSPDEQVMARVASLIRDFDDDRYEVRQAATKEIKEIGAVALTALEEAQKSSSLEVQLRARMARRDLMQAKLIAELPGHKADVVTISVSPDNRWVATGSKEGSLKVWSTADWSLVRNLNVPQVDPVGN